MGIKKLDEAEILVRLHGIKGWNLLEGKLHRDFEFKNFSEAFAFMARAALLSEKKDHHPEWYNVYNKVRIDLYTHECGGISERDFEWAKVVNEFYDEC